MSNEEHVEEMFYLAHISGVFSQFSKKIKESHIINPKKSICEITEDVFNDFTVDGLINDEIPLFI